MAERRRALVEPVELAEPLDLAERPRAGDWSLRTALTRFVRGGLCLTRHAIDLALDPPATRFLSRGEILNKLA